MKESEMAKSLILKFTDENYFSESNQNENAKSTALDAVDIFLEELNMLHKSIGAISTFAAVLIKQRIEYWERVMGILNES